MSQRYRSVFWPAVLTPPNRKLNRGYYLETMNTILGFCRFSNVLTDLPEIAAPSADISSSALLPDTAFVQFSSGTTGIKRGVEIRHGCARTNQYVLARYRTHARGPHHKLVAPLSRHGIYDLAEHGTGMWRALRDDAAC